MTVLQRIKLLLGVTYRCHRCGAFVPRDCRALHEEFHTALRDFFSPPTAEELTAARRIAQMKFPAASRLDGQG